MDSNSSILFESESVSPSVDSHSHSAPLQRKYPCRHCTKVLTSSSNRSRHERQIHPQLISDRTANITLTCIFCGKSCLGQRSLQLHAQSCRGASAPSPSIQSNSAAANSPIISSNLEPAIQSSSLFVARPNNNNNNNNNNNILEQSFSANSIPLTSQSKKHRKNESHSSAIVVSDSSDSDSSPNSHSDSDFNSDSESNTRRSLNAALSQAALLNDEQLNSIVDGFLHWLQQGPETVIEQSIKKRRLTDDKQLLPVKTNLRFLCTVVVSITAISTTELTLSHLVHVDTVKSLTAHFEQRKIGPARVYVLALLLKKICVYLCSRQSTTSMLYISPQTLPSWSLIDHHCHQSSKKRKMRQRDRMVLHTSQLTMTNSELSLVVQGCLSVMDKIIIDYNRPESVGLSKSEAKRYTEYFITACFVLLLAPRQQVFRQLTTETLVAPRCDGANEDNLNNSNSFNNNNSSNKNYTIRMSAEHSKVGYPVLLRVPNILTAKLEFYLFRILPADHVGHLFLQRGDKPRKDFSSATRAVTKHLICRAINAHQFRHCIATLFYGRRDSSDVLMRQLADTMNHDSQTQMQFYVHQQRLESQERMQSMLMEQVGMANNNNNN